jgi:hypothetical protein
MRLKGVYLRGFIYLILYDLVGVNMTSFWTNVSSFVATLTTLSYFSFAAYNRFVLEEELLTFL